MAQAVSSELLAEFGALLRDEPEPALIDVEVLAEMEALAEVAASPEPAPEPAPEQAREPAAEPIAQEVPLPEATSAPAEWEPQPTAEDASEGAAPAGLSMVAAQPNDPALSLVQGAAPKPLSLVNNSPRPALTVVDSAGQDSSAQPPSRAESADSGPDTTAFMRELSSLSDDPDKTEPVVTRLVVPLTEQRRKRRPWSR